MIQLIDVHKSYTKDHETIKGVSFEVHEGQIFGLLGPNGAGKTTLMQMIATLMKPTSGEIIIDGLSGEKNLLEIHRKIGFLTNEIKLDPLSTPNILFDFFAKFRPSSFSTSLRTDLISSPPNRLRITLRISRPRDMRSFFQHISSQ